MHWLLSPASVSVYTFWNIGGVGGVWVLGGHFRVWLLTQFSNELQEASFHKMVSIHSCEMELGYFKACFIMRGGPLQSDIVEWINKCCCQ